MGRGVAEEGFCVKALSRIDLANEIGSSICHVSDENAIFGVHSRSTEINSRISRPPMFLFYFIFSVLGIKYVIF